MTVTQLFRRFWKSGRHVGSARPQQTVEIRYGRISREHRKWKGDDVDATIPGAGNRPWQGYWEPKEDWKDVPNVQTFSTSQDFNDNGIENFTLIVENVDMEEVEGATGDRTIVRGTRPSVHTEPGAGGTFHRIVRGFLSPWRGYRAPGRPKDGLTKNDWYSYMNRAAQIRVKQGYGDEMVTTFTGLIDKIDLVSRPDRVTVTGRDFGQLFTDQHIFGWVVERQLKTPIIFADRKQADDQFEEGASSIHDCSDYNKNHPPRFATDKNRKSYWASEYREEPNRTVYLDIRVPAGRYTSIELHPAYGGMDCYLSVKAKAKGSRKGKVWVEGEEVDPGWIDLGKGDVPGDTFGGHPFMRRIRKLPLEKSGYGLGAEIEVGDDSIFRVSFRNLRKVSDSNGHTKYRAGVKHFKGWRRKRKPEAKTNQWIVVDDLSDIVKVVFRWAGFKEWDVEQTGMRLPIPLTFHQGDFLIDIIRKCSEITNYTFFMGGPTGSDEVLDTDDKDEYSIGHPIFRRARVIQEEPDIEEVRDKDILTGIQVTYDDSPLPYIIRIRGAPADKRKGKKKRHLGGKTLGEDKSLRYMYTYKPLTTKDSGSEFAFGGTRAGILRHYIKTYEHLESEFECEIAARWVALASSLASMTGVIEIPANPAIGLDSHIGVRDKGVGVNMRLYIASKQTEFVTGLDAHWTMGLGGAMVDNPYVVGELKLLNEALDEGEPPEAKKPKKRGAKKKKGHGKK